MSRWKPHSQKQQDALYSKHPLTVVATGIQWGKTTVGAIWLKMMMHRYTDPGDNFIITSPTFPIISQSTLPPFLKLMEGLGVHNKQLNCFKMYGGGTCWFRTGTEPDSIVGIPKVRAILADEAGKYSLYFWENIQGRADPNNAPIMIVTSPYSLNWMYREIIRPKMKDVNARPDVKLIQASSIENPHFNQERYYSREMTMDPRRFKMMYGGGWDKVDGLVYDCYDEDENQCDAFPIPQGSRIVGGIDWGFTEPFVFKIRAIAPDGMHYSIHEVYRSGMTISDIVKVVQSLVVTYSVTTIYCDPSQPAHIEELNRTFRQQGIKCGAVPANNDIRIGIDRHYELIKTRRYKLFRNLNTHTVDELETYHYPAIDDLKPDQKVIDQKPVQQNDHACFLAGTLIRCKRGLIPIEEVVSGDYVNTPLGLSKVVDGGLVGFKETYELVFDDGSSVNCTKDHPFYFRFSGFLPIDAKRYSSIVHKWEKSNLTEKSIIGMAGIGLATAVKTVCMLLFGNFIAAIFLKVFISIIKTIIETITRLKTLKCFRSLSTQGITEAALLKGKEKKGGIESIGLDTFQSFGTLAQKVGRGIENTVNLLWLIASRENFSVKDVAHNTSLRGIDRDFARLIVSLLLDAKAVLMTLFAPVLSVLRILKLINTSKPNAVRLDAVYKNDTEQPVYNLTTEFGCYYANDILVSNCDADRYITMSTYTAKGVNVPIVPNEKKDEQDPHKRYNLIRKRGGVRTHIGHTEKW